MEGVVAVTVTGYLCENIGSASQGEVKRFKHQDRGTFTHDEPIPIQVERPRVGQRIIIPGGESGHIPQTRHRHGNNDCIAAAGKHLHPPYPWRIVFMAFTQAFVPRRRRTAWPYQDRGRRKWIATIEEAASGKIIGTINGLTLFGPCW